MYYRTASIMLNAGQKGGTASDIFIAQPDFHKESLAGKLFILIELESEKSDALKVINFLINNLNHNYYQNEKVVLRERIDSLKVEHIFETALAKTNKDLVDFLSREKIKISPYAFNATVAVIHEDNIHFSTVGKNKNLLIYRDKPQTKNSSEQEAEYKITEVSDNKERKTKQTNLTKLFSEVTSGRVPTNAYFLLVNEALSEYLSNKQLTDIVTTLPPQGAATQIKNTLSQVNAVVAFLGIIIKNTTAPEKMPETEEDIEHADGDSATALNNTEEETEKILAPSGVINFGYWTKKIFKMINSGIQFLISKIKTKKGRNDFKSTPKAKLLPLKDKVFFKKRHSQFSFASIFSILKRTGIFITRIIRYIFDQAIKVLKDKEKLKNIKASIKNSPQTLINKSKKGTGAFKKLQKKYKIVLSVSALLLIALVINISLLDMEQDQENKTKRINELLSKIENNQNKIEANLLYQNEEGAKELANKNRPLIKELEEMVQPEERKEKKYQDIFSKQEELLQELRHAINLEGAEHLFALTDLRENPDASDLVLNNNNIYIADKKHQSIYNIDLENNTGSVITGIEDTIDSPRYPVEIENNIHYLDENNILQLNANSEKLSEISLDSSSADMGSISSMASYANNIYLLDTGNNQIYKYQKQAEAFSSEREWLQEQVDLTNAIDLAIDGNIYILNKNGEIKKYLQGEEVELGMNAPEPPFQQASKIKVSETMNEGYIYVLEPKQNRLVIFNKEGKFLMQYKDSGFSDLKDMAIDEKNKKIYLLNADSVYRIKAKHLE